MGYDIHITRKKYYFDEEGEAISEKERLDYISDDPELILKKEQGEFYAQWSGKCKYYEPWFDDLAGNIYTKNPDENILAKMLQIASELNAKVQGDDGELYIRPDLNDGFINEE